MSKTSPLPSVPQATTAPTTDTGNATAARLIEHPGRRGEADLARGLDDAAGREVLGQLREVEGPAHDEVALAGLDEVAEERDPRPGRRDDGDDGEDAGRHERLRRREHLLLGLVDRLRDDERDGDEPDDEEDALQQTAAVHARQTLQRGSRAGNVGAAVKGAYRNFRAKRSAYASHGISAIAPNSGRRQSTRGTDASTAA